MTAIRVLLIDDDENDSILTRLLFEQMANARYEVTWANSYDEGLKQIASAGYDVCLLDHSLGVRSGLDLLRCAREAKARLPFILLTGSQAHNLDEEALAAGVADFLVKSQITPALLDRSLRYAIGHQQTQENLEKARDAAELAMRVRSEFLANMSHEIRTPMNGVIGMTSLLLETSLLPEQREYVETIRASGETLLVLINDILDFSKIESGKIELEQHEFDLATCVEESMMLFKMKAREKNIELLYLIHPGVPQTVCGDVTRLRQILSNLVSNALKFTLKGEVEISVEVAAQGVGERTTCTLGFSVRDTGIGIPQNKRHRLFQNFSQVDASTTRQFGGTGLGLAISKRLCELMGGTMDVESVEGVGSTFRFTVAVGVAATRRTIYTAGSMPSLSQRKILVVDDNATNRRIMQLYLGGWGVASAEAADASEALRILGTEPNFDACLVDFHMPDCDGLELAAKIRGQYSRAAVPIIVLTSSSREEIRESAGKLGVGQVLEKPIKPSALHHALMEVLHEHGSAQPERTAPGHTVEIAGDHPFSILVADDNSVNQMVAKRMLGRLGYLVDTVSDGAEVLLAFTHRNYDIVFMDMQMPEMDGIEATRKLRSWPEIRQPWIIAMTAAAMHEDRERCFKASMDDYVGKPVRLQDLSDALLRAWAGIKSKEQRAF